MALLDSTSLYSNNTIVTKWANEKIGSIIPFEDNQYIFVEHEHVDELHQEKYSENEWKEKCPVLAYGFVSYWLRNRKRKTKRAERLDIFAPEDRGKTPKEIYDLYIEARKKWFLEYMSNRPDAWRYPDLEKLFYEQNLTVASEEELILKSEPLLDYLDEEDKKEFIDIMGNFLSYVDSIVEPYQHVKVKETPKQLFSGDDECDEITIFKDRLKKAYHASMVDSVKGHCYLLAALCAHGDMDEKCSWLNGYNIESTADYLYWLSQMIEEFNPDAKKTYSLIREINRYLKEKHGETDYFDLKGKAMLETFIKNHYKKPHCKLAQAACSLAGKLYDILDGIDE